MRVALHITADHGGNGLVAGILRDMLFQFGDIGDIHLLGHAAHTIKTALLYQHAGKALADIRFFENGECVQLRLHGAQCMLHTRVIVIAVRIMVISQRGLVQETK